MAINEEEKVDAGMDIKRNMEREKVDTVAQKGWPESIQSQGWR